MNHLAVMLDLSGRRALVVGGSAIAARRVAGIARAGGQAMVVAERLAPEFEDGPDFEHRARPFETTDLDGAALVFVTAEDEALATRISALAQQRDIPVNVTDRLALCSFIMPALVERPPLQVAISSSGTAPILARLLRGRFESELPQDLGRLATLAGNCRQRVRELIEDPVRRRRFWEWVADGPVAEQVLAGHLEAARSLLLETAAARAGEQGEPVRGEVYLVGAGPGAPDLLTFRALRLMQQADVVLHDRLVPDAILELVRRDAERVFVGKQRGEHALPQAEISRLLVELARQGKRVLRLKGGDPFVFGRGGEEIEALAAASVSFQVVPGISAANGAAAYAGIPLTHRDHAQSCIFVSGHDKDGRLNLDWPHLVRPGQTVVVFMGLRTLDQFSAEMLRHGADARTPVAIVENATREGQRVVTGTLGQLAEISVDSALSGPIVVIVGSVVTLRERLSWFASGDTPS